VQGNRGPSVFEIPALIAEFREKAKLVDEVSSPFVEEDMGFVEDIVDTNAGLHWRLDCLNQNIGPLTGGSLGHIFARPETGKTSFLVNEVSYFAGQLQDDEKIIWIWNEEPWQRIKYRFLQSFLNMKREEIYDLLSRYGKSYLQEQWEQHGGRRILFQREEDPTYEDIIALLEKTPNVRVLVCDIADHITFRKSGDMANHERLEELYRRFRNISNSYGVSILTSAQAAEAASDRKHLFMEHMANSKTGKPGALDYAIGIGKVNDNEEMRWLSIPKNKRGTTVTPINPIMFDRERGRYSDI
jgi:replicative DNA helicase